MARDGGMTVDLELLKKYDRPGPRYTSYPTAPLFTEEFGADQFRDEIAVSNQGDELPDLSLYFHFPFCHSLCYFCGCNMTITHDRGRIADYLGYLRREIDLLGSLVNERRRVVQMHWGGGTPTYYSPEQMRWLQAMVLENFELTDGAEVAIEIDPRVTSTAHVDALSDMGFSGGRRSQTERRGPSGAPEWRASMTWSPYHPRPRSTA